MVDNNEGKPHQCLMKTQRNVLYQSHAITLYIYSFHDV
jgi:hypothetical protein